MRRTAHIAFLLISSAMTEGLACPMGQAIYEPVSGGAQYQGFRLEFFADPQGSFPHLRGELRMPGERDPIALEVVSARGVMESKIGLLRAVFFLDSLAVVPVPESGHAAPAYMFIPELGDALRWQLRDRRNSDDVMWRLSSCR